MGGNKKPEQQQQTGYGPNAGQSGNDPRGRLQNQSQYQQSRYESQQGPMADAMGYNYGRASEADYGNYSDIMNQYRDIASNSGSSAGGSGGGGGGGGGYSAFTVNPERVSAERATSRGLGPLERVKASNPFQSYGGMQEFSQTGGYSGQDIANMRARGMAPIRAAYANAERNIGQQRSLQGGYSPNAIAAQGRMAREQGQSMADAATGVEAGIAQARNQGRLSGLQGMGNIEGQQLGAQMQGDIFNAGQSNEGQKFDIGNEMNTSQFNAGQGNQIGMFNSEMGMKGQMYNADAQSQAQAQNNAAAERAGARSAAASAENQQNRLAALNGMQNLYGTTPGMTNMFGNQLMSAVNQGGTFGLNLMEQDRLSQQAPGAYEQGMGRARDLVGMGAQVGYPIYDALSQRNQQQGQRSVYTQNPPVQQYNPNQYLNQNTMINPNSWQAPTQQQYYGDQDYNIWDEGR